ncbi:MAG TPA: DNA repair exonuclease [Acetobacteraceae bacterium]|nr:DNA repair exonuclease [Acetobacteraceae bacterium]
MTSYKILHAADLHIDSPLRGLEADPDAPADLIRGATRAAFSKLVDFALEQNVAILLIAGDLYDGDWQDWRTGQFLVRELERLTRAGIRVVAISGNHDAESVLTKKLRWPENARLLATDRAETVIFDDLGLAVHGRGFRDKAVVENLVPSYPPPIAGHLNIGLLHTSATGHPDHARYAPCSIEQLANHGYAYWALGHIHTRDILCRDPWIIFPGNLQGRHIREEGSKGATLITVEDGRIVGEPQHHACDTVRWQRIEVDVGGAADEEESLARARHKLAEALEAAEGRLLAARLCLTGATAAHETLLRNPGDMREKLRAEALAAGGAGILWLEQIDIDTSPVTAAAARDPLAERLLTAIRDPNIAALLAELGPYASQLLERATFLRGALGDDDPAVQIAAGALPDTMLEQARAMLLARLI